MDFYGLKGHESMSQASAGVYIFNETALKERQKSCDPTTQLPSTSAA
jgi:hypothetical protein